jgi:hypothetical protein
VLEGKNLVIQHGGETTLTCQLGLRNDNLTPNCSEKNGLKLDVKDAAQRFVKAFDILSRCQ